MSAPMSRLVRVAVFGAALSAFACDHPQPGGPSASTEVGGGAAPGASEDGAIGLHLVVPTGQTIPVVSWAITGPNNASTVVQSGVVTSRGAGASFLVGSLPPASGYQIALSGTAMDGSLTCTGSALFAIQPRTTTQVLVELACSVATGGSHVVLVDGTSFNCAAWDNVSASPTEANVGATVVLSATAAAPVPSAVTYSWSAPSGTFGTPHAATTNFTCTAAGVVNVTLVVGDGPVPAGQSCDTALDTKVVPVTCDSVGPPPIPAMPPWGLGSFAACISLLGAAALRRRGDRRRYPAAAESDAADRT